MMIDQRQLGEAVRSIRKLRGLTQEELAKAVGVASNTMAVLERGERAFSLKMLNALGKALDVPAACLAIMGSPSSGTRNPAASQVLAKLQSLIAATIQVERQEKPGARVAKGKRPLAKRSA
ncbi:MAG TPA: helix-turn-helix transcriptional regulator [Pirellulales bacterium]|nr:helix-turn-helix transcriptional regulator [Pirellulales bacterium]